MITLFGGEESVQCFSLDNLDGKENFGDLIIYGDNLKTDDITHEQKICFRLT